MLFIHHNTFDPYFHLAAEEYLLKNKSENVFMLWRSAPAVVSGKHQNILSEINYRYVRELNIIPARRLSGGGTVVHDLNNLNFTFIANGEEGKLIDFKKFVSPIVEYLAVLGVSATIGEKNDIRINDLKISGNAEHVYRKRVLHHGTLLFNSNLEQLRKAINTGKSRYFDKAVQSNRSSVTNIVDHLSQTIAIEEFTDGLRKFISEKHDHLVDYLFTSEDLGHIAELRNQKYSTLNWIFGYSPRYSFKNEFIFTDNSWRIELDCEQGVILKADIRINNKNHTVLEQLLLHQPHLYESVNSIIKKQFSTLNANDAAELVYHFF